MNFQLIYCNHPYQLQKLPYSLNVAFRGCSSHHGQPPWQIYPINPLRMMTYTMFLYTQSILPWKYPIFSKLLSLSWLEPHRNLDKNPHEVSETPIPSWLPDNMLCNASYFCPFYLRLNCPSLRHNYCLTTGPTHPMWILQRISHQWWDRATWLPKTIPHPISISYCKFFSWILS